MLPKIETEVGCMGQYTRILDKFEYYVSDCECPLCLHWCRVTKGCSLSACLYAEIMREARAAGRIERPREAMPWS